MLIIRLSRIGRRKKPFYRLIISEKTKDTFGDNMEILGTYDPHTKKTEFKQDRIKHWLSKGAQTSSVVNNLFIKEKIVSGKKSKAVSISKKRQSKIDAKKKEVEKAQAPKAETPAPEAPASTETAS